MVAEYCKDCKHYVDTNSILGLCRRYPTYQNRSPQEVCGEFFAKAVAEVSPAGDFLRAKRMGRPPKVKPEVTE
jgi:hypothetical protein